MTLLYNEKVHIIFLELFYGRITKQFQKDDVNYSGNDGFLHCLEIW